MVSVQEERVEWAGLDDRTVPNDEDKRSGKRRKENNTNTEIDTERHDDAIKEGTEELEWKRTTKET
jgi:hypothetical protein